MSTTAEQTANDTYLIESKNELKKVAYRKNLLTKLQNEFPEKFGRFSEESLNDSNGFREFVSTAESCGVAIYQLTRL